MTLLITGVVLVLAIVVEVSPDIVASYQMALLSMEKKNGERLSIGTQHQLTKPVRPHRLRHACATHMLKGGADIRHIQKLLGHATLQTTQIYTRVEIGDLKAVHRRFHPRERGPRR